MYFFDATHTSVNADPALAPVSDAQTLSRQIEKVNTEPTTYAVPPAPDPQVITPASHLYESL